MMEELAGPKVGPDVTADCAFISAAGQEVPALPVLHLGDVVALLDPACVTAAGVRREVKERGDRLFVWIQRIACGLEHLGRDEAKPSTNPIADSFTLQRWGILQGFRPGSGSGGDPAGGGPEPAE
jgi:hypothetical protein